MHTILYCQIHLLFSYLVYFNIIFGLNFSTSLRTIVSDQIANFLVLPHKLTIPLVENISITDLKYPLPPVSWLTFTFSLLLFMPSTKIPVLIYWTFIVLTCWNSWPILIFKTWNDILAGNEPAIDLLNLKRTHIENDGHF